MKLRLTGGYDYGSGDGTAESYCFDDWGYLYVNTVTPDGYQVNELGAWVQDGEVHDYGNHLGSYGMPRLHRLVTDLPLDSISHCCKCAGKRLNA